jgi:TonB family protein
VEERLRASSQLTLPESVLQTQMAVPADPPFMVADAASATASPIQLPALKDTPPRLIAAPAMLKSASSEVNLVPPRAISRRPPVYPDFAKSSLLQGDVMLLVSISSTGAVRTAKVLSGNALLAKAAEDAALHWSFTPGLRNGIAVDSQTQVLVRFRLQ